MPLLIALCLLITSELSIQTEKVEAFLLIVYDVLEVSRSFSGNQSLDIFLDLKESEKVLFIEQWESGQHFQKYYQLRLELGDFEILGEYFSAPPAMRMYRALGEPE